MKLLRKREFVPSVLLILVFIAGIIESPHFLDARYLLDASSTYAETGLLALGMTLVIVAGQIDLSVAATMALVACVGGKLLATGMTPAIAVAIGLLLGAGLGAINGFCVATLRLPSFIVTLATLAAYRGAAQAMLGPNSVTITNRFAGADMINFPGTPLPIPLVIFLMTSLAIGFLLHGTVLGRWIYTVGTNMKASFFAGVPTTRVTITVFTLSGLLAGAAGFLIDSRLGVARYDHARGLEVDVITAVVLGGASIYGGVGSVLGTVLAVILLGLLRTGMTLANVTAEYQMSVVGTLLIVSVLVANLTDRLARTRVSKTPRTSRKSSINIHSSASESHS